MHGAWVGNVDRTAARPLLMDFELVSVGPSERDLASTSVKMTTTGAVTEAEYAEFRETYGLCCSIRPGSGPADARG